MKCYITVVGKDTVGIIARTSAFMYDNNINILDISQSITNDIFHMMMVIDISKSSLDFKDVASNLKDIGTKIGVDIKLQHEDIFNAMHRI